MEKTGPDWKKYEFCHLLRMTVISYFTKCRQFLSGGYNCSKPFSSIKLSGQGSTLPTTCLFLKYLLAFRSNM